MRSAFRDPRMNSLLLQAGGSPGMMQQRAGSLPLHTFIARVDRNQRHSVPGPRHVLANPSEIGGGHLSP